MPSKEDKFVWVVDEPAAEVVREIFRMFISGMGIQVICRQLYNRGIKNPTSYKAERDGKPPRIKLKLPDTHWAGITVTNILDNLEYTGTAVMQKITSKSYKDHKQFIRPESEWITHDNAHLPIIDKETFETAKRLRANRRKPTVAGDLGVLNGLMVCEDCGGKLHLKRQIKKGKGGIRLEYNYYKCRNARQFSEFATCFCHAIKREPLEQLVLEDIQRIVSLAKTSEKKFVEKVTTSEGKERKQTIKKAETELSKAKFRIDELDRIISKTYEHNVSGKLSDERFQKMLNGYESEQSELKTKVAELEKVIAEANTQTENADRFLALVRRYTEPTELTGELVREFVEKIVVGKAQHSDSGFRKKVQSVKIVYNYIGEFGETIMKTQR